MSNSENIVGIMWNRNEADILTEMIEAAVQKVDALLIADDGSTDTSWRIIQDLRAKHPEIVHIQQKPNPRDQGQRQALLTEVRRRYKIEDTWVQVMESDIKIVDTDIRDAISQFAHEDLCVSWQALNAVRAPGTWDEVDTYPHWKKSITDVMDHCHMMEVMLYTFRPLPGIDYTSSVWRPWPQGWNRYTKRAKHSKKNPDSPLLAHYGFRGPTHFLKKYGKGGTHRKYRNWDLTDEASVLRTVSFFNGDWNSNPFPISREGWKKWLRSTSQT